MPRGSHLSTTLVQPDPALAAIVGADPISRAEIMRRLWRYIDQHGLKSPTDKRIIIADETFRAFINGDQVHMLQIAGAVSHHVRKVE